MVFDRHFDNPQTTPHQLGRDLMIGLKAACAQRHTLDHGGWIELIGRERVRDPALVEQRGPQRQ